MTDAYEILHCNSSSGTPVVSVLVGRRYAYSRHGSCEAIEGFGFTLDPELYTDIAYPGRTKPAQVRRDIDVWGWKDGTDVVVQGRVRRDRATRSMAVELTCAGPSPFSQRIVVTGDRRVEKVGAGLRLSQPVPFHEMPMRWDKAYGGTDEKAEDRLLDERYRRLLTEQIDPVPLHRWSEYAYPRNPAGKGFLIDAVDAEGLAWPNLEFPDDTLTLSNLAAPLDRWGERPFPACWDFLPYHWFPRSVVLFDPTPTHDGRMPGREVELGLVPANLLDLELTERPWPLLGRVAHPFLQPHRLQGTEMIRATAMGPEGEDAFVQLPDEYPVAHLRLNGGRQEQTLPPVLDLVVLETGERRLTLVWRCSLSPAPDAMHVDWKARTQVRLSWRRRGPR